MVLADWWSWTLPVHKSSGNWQVLRFWFWLTRQAPSIWLGQQLPPPPLLRISHSSEDFNPGRNDWLDASPENATPYPCLYLRLSNMTVEPIAVAQHFQMHRRQLRGKCSLFQASLLRSPPLEYSGVTLTHFVRCASQQHLTCDAFQPISQTHPGDRIPAGRCELLGRVWTRFKLLTLHRLIPHICVTVLPSNWRVATICIGFPPIPHICVSKLRCYMFQFTSQVYTLNLAWEGTKDIIFI